MNQEPIAPREMRPEFSQELFQKINQVGPEPPGRRPLAETNAPEAPLLKRTLAKRSFLRKSSGRVKPYFFWMAWRGGWLKSHRPSSARRQLRAAAPARIKPTLFIRHAYPIIYGTMPPAGAG